MVTVEQLRDLYGTKPTWQLYDIRRAAYAGLKLPGVTPDQLADLFVVLGVISEQLLIRGVVTPRRGPFYMNGRDGVPCPIDD